MALHIVLDNEWATVRYDTDGKYMYHTFHQPITGQIFRTTMNTGLEALQANRATKWLSDDRLNGEFSPEDVGFALSDWGPRAARAGWKFWALVVPESMAGRISMSGIVEAFHELGVRVSVFTDLDEARAWLLRM